MKASIHRPTVARVDVEAIADNFQQVMAHLSAETKGLAVVKANAYGHGVQQVARQLAPLVDGFCVSNIDEALDLRQSGIEAPILVLGVVPISVAQLAIDFNITLAVASLEWVYLLLETGLDLDNLIVHLKVDSGMGRIGFRNKTELETAQELLLENGASVQGIFTHFATADEQDQQQFEAQLAFFQELIRSLDSCPQLVHASNSATSIWHPETVFNAVRLGDVLYGLNPSGRTLEMPYPIQPALSLTSELVHVKQVESGAKVGYGGTYTASGEEWIGTVPIGYADGFIRKMQGFKVLVDGQFCPVVGRVSMDQITLRLPRSYPIGTRVTLIGEDNDQEITTQDWADYLQTINYEVVCLLSDRIPRVYD
ncbi:alanine racemase [Streptococcus gallinaceus]|uniref:Alanine racemase n=1 Tax=Streptococcus gallinaceus TaxID=165758 RepID=A0ABV2JNX7_9STRE